MKFKVGDTIRNKTTGREYTIGVVSDVMYWLVGYGSVPIDNADSSYELVEQPNFVLADYKKMWDEHVLRMTTEITKKNTDAFAGIIDNTLRYLDCDGVRDDVRLGYRLFAGELKKQLLCDNIKTDYDYGK